MSAPIRLKTKAENQKAFMRRSDVVGIKGMEALGTIEEI